MPARQISVPFCSSSVSDSRNGRRLNTSPMVDARVSELFKVLDAAQQQGVYLLCVQGILQEGRKAVEVGELH